MDEEQEETAQPDIESQARKMGWLPQEDFRGNKANWVPADEYVKRGETFVPFLQAERKKLERELSVRDQKLSHLETQLKEASETIETLKEFRTALNKERVEELSTELVQGIREARESGDIAGEEALREKLAAAKKTLEEPVAIKPPAPPPAAAETPEWKEFVAANPWWNDDPAMRAASVAIGARLAQDGELNGLTPMERFNKVAEATKARFGMNEQPRTSRVGTSKGGGGTNLSDQGGGQSWNDLPADVREAAKRFETRLVGTKKGQFPDLASFRKNYASEFFRKYAS